MMAELWTGFLKPNFSQDFEATVWSNGGWSLFKFLRLKFGGDFETEVWLRFKGWSLVDILNLKFDLKAATLVKTLNPSVRSVFSNHFTFWLISSVVLWGLGILINMFLPNRRPPAPPVPSVPPDLERGAVRGHRSCSLRRRRLQVEGALQTFKIFVFIFDCLKSFFTYFLLFSHR